MRSEGFRNLICAVLLSLAVATVLTGCINAWHLVFSSLDTIGEVGRRASPGVELVPTA
jgi:hypothetical protein